MREAAAPRPPREPVEPRVANASAFLAVLELAAALPVRHEPELHYPRLPSPTGR